MSEPKCRDCGDHDGVCPNGNGLRFCSSAVTEAYEKRVSDLESGVLLMQAAGRIAELEAAGRALLEWDKRYPKGTIYDKYDTVDIAPELDAIIDRFRGLLESSDKGGK